MISFGEYRVSLFVILPFNNTPYKSLIMIFELLILKWGMYDQISNTYEIGSENISMKSPREGNHPPESQTIRHLT